MTHVCEDIRLLNVKTLWKTHSESVFWTSDTLKLQPKYACVFNISPAPCSCWNHRRIYCLSYFFIQRLSQLNTFHLDFWAEKKSFCLCVLPPVLLLGDTGSLLWLAGWSVSLFVSVLLEGLWDFLFLMRILPISSWGLGRGTPGSSCKYTQ